MPLQSLTPNLMVEDVNAAVDWYKDMLGFELKMSNPESGTFEWAMLQSGEVKLMFEARASLEGELPALKEKPVGASGTFFIRLDDVKALYDRISGKVEIVSGLKKTSYGSEEFSITDNNGYILTFAQFG
ncbi:MAG: VOC family protein [candidate division Zixibacteria bacterium]|nr:VOC family protein [candidate division Zixibacteria bacterium]